MTSINEQDIDAVCGLAEDLCGIVWDESKAYLIEARLSSLVESTNSENYVDLVNKVRANLVPGLKDEVLNAVTTNETLWFRDSSPFKALQYKLLPEIIDGKASSPRPQRLRMFSAACSTGQEPYSMAMTVAETISDVENWDVQITGVDISPGVVEHASRGIYDKLEVSRGLDLPHLSKYFVERDDRWQVHDRIRVMCNFQQQNLLKLSPSLGKFDIIFCRNVAIYFNPEDRRLLFEQLAKMLEPGGWLVTGSSESLINLGSEWMPKQHCGANCYQPQGALATA